VLVVLGVVAAVPPLTSHAQQKPAKVPRIGFLDYTSSDIARTRLERLRAGLRDLGYVEGKNIAIVVRSAEGETQRLTGLAAELVEMKVDVIVATGTPAIQAAQRATNTIPIVMGTVGDPVGPGFVASLSRPGGNITGLTSITADLSSKYLELLRTAVPKLSRVAVLMNSGNPSHARLFVPNILAAAKKNGVTIVPVQLNSANQINAAFSAVKQERVGALIVLPDGLFYAQARRIAEFALQQHLPTMFADREPVETGGLMSYGQNLADNFYRAATYVDKILKGAKPGELPVEQPTKLELVINRKTARAIGLKIPQELILRADRVIE
jgi:putative ABC transport system substrate-binding protein